MDNAKGIDDDTQSVSERRVGEGIWYNIACFWHKNEMKDQRIGAIKPRSKR